MKNDKENYIGVFDSGVGGLTVLKEMLKLLPKENFIYYSDGGNAPYGEKSEKEIQMLCINILDFLLKKKCKAVVVACNTATVAALEILMKKTSVPIIGVISGGIEEALETTKNKKIGILGTLFTINSGAYRKGLISCDDKLEIFQSACIEFCPMIEKGWDNFDNRLHLVEKYLEAIPKNVDTLVLGCTHYPIIERDINKFFKGKIINPAKKTALNLKKSLEENNISRTSNNNQDVKFFTTGDAKIFKELAEKFLEINIIIKVEKIK